MTSLRKELLRLYSPHASGRFYMLLKMAIIPLEEFSQILPRKGVIIDVGCGYGYVANYLSLYSPEREVLGIDLDERRIEACRRTVGQRTNITFVTGDLSTMDLPPADGIIMADVLHHVPYPGHTQVLNAIHRSLKDGGIFLMRETRIAYNIRFFLFNYLLEALLYPKSEKLNFRRDSEWSQLLIQSGFRILRIIPNQGSFPYICSSYHCSRV